jgi:hypothetical protein
MCWIRVYTTTMSITSGRRPRAAEASTKPAPLLFSGRHCRKALQNASAFDNPVRVEAEALMEMVVRDNPIRHIAARSHYADAGEPATSWAKRWFVFFVHRIDRSNEPGLG